MVSIDFKSFRERVLFAIKHHGTRTQGEEYRQGQVADYITEMTLQLVSLYEDSSKVDTGDIHFRLSV